MATIDKILNIGIGECGQIFCKVKFQNGKLSITGVEGPMHNGDARGSCGQIDETIASQILKIQFADGWNIDLARQFLAIWDRWHLNDMRAGSKPQEDYLRQNPVKAVYPASHYDLASKVLADAGLNPDASGYKYGHAWNKEEIPDDVIAFLESLPSSKVQPAWV